MKRSRPCVVARDLRPELAPRGAGARPPRRSLLRRGGAAPSLPRGASLVTGRSAALTRVRAGAPWREVCSVQLKRSETATPATQAISSPDTTTGSERRSERGTLRSLNRSCRDFVPPRPSGLMRSPSRQARTVRVPGKPAGVQQRLVERAQIARHGHGIGLAATAPSRRSGTCPGTGSAAAAGEAASGDRAGTARCRTPPTARRPPPRSATPLPPRSASRSISRIRPGRSGTGPPAASLREAPQKQPAHRGRLGRDRRAASTAGGRPPAPVRRAPRPRPARAPPARRAAARRSRARCRPPPGGSLAAAGSTSRRRRFRASARSWFDSSSRQARPASAQYARVSSPRHRPAAGARSGP